MRQGRPRRSCVRTVFGRPKKCQRLNGLPAVQSMASLWRFVTFDVRCPSAPSFAASHYYFGGASNRIARRCCALRNTGWPFEGDLI
ncbi:hypothetical protein SUS17_4037 [Sphingomonas sp. S17]|nr:hypothetical protein SUS17_4037 [Sphingomonas sp. S17]